MARRNTSQPTCPSCWGFLPSSGQCARCARHTANGSFSPSSNGAAGTSSPSSPSSPAPSDQLPSPPSGPSSRTSSWSTSPTIVVEPFSDAPMAPPEEASEQAFGPSLETVQSAFQISEDQSRALLIFTFDMLSTWRGEHWRLSGIETSPIVPPLTRQINAHERIARLVGQGGDWTLIAFGLCSIVGRRVMQDRQLAKQTLAQQEYQRYERIRSDAPAEPRASQPDSRPPAPAAREANGAVDELTSVDLSGTGATLPPAAVSSLFTNRTA